MKHYYVTETYYVGGVGFLLFVFFGLPLIIFSTVGTVLQWLFQPVIDFLQPIYLPIYTYITTHVFQSYVFFIVFALSYWIIKIIVNIMDVDYPHNTFLRIIVKVLNVIWRIVATLTTTLISFITFLIAFDSHTNSSILLQLEEAFEMGYPSWAVIGCAIGLKYGGFLLLWLANLSSIFNTSYFEKITSILSYFGFILAMIGFLITLLTGNINAIAPGFRIVILLCIVHLIVRYKFLPRLL